MGQRKLFLKAMAVSTFVLLLSWFSGAQGVKAATTTQVTVTPTTLSNFFNTSGTATLGTGTSAGTATLTPDQNDKAGAIYLKNRISLKDSFHLEGSINLGTRLDINGGADGIGFAFNPNQSDQLGISGANMGIGGLKNAIGFKMDTYRNASQSADPNASTESNRFGWKADPDRITGKDATQNGASGNIFGSFVTTDATSGVASVVPGSAQFLTSPSSYLSSTSLLGTYTERFVPISFDYAYSSATNSGLITVKYGPTTGLSTVYQWTYTVTSDYITAHPTVGFAISASTGGNKNLQQFKMTSFTYNASTKITVSKIWSDNADQYKNRPDSLTMSVLNKATQEVVATVTLNAANSWQATVDNLPAVDATNTALSYTIKETTVPAGYTASAVTDGTEASSITNTINTRTIKLVKTWVDASNKDAKRPTSLALAVQPLDKDGNKLGAAIAATVTASGSWTTSVALPTYVNKTEVKKLAVSEDSVPTNYQLTSIVPNSTADIPSDGTYTVTNTQTMTIPVKKIWNDRDNFLGKRTAVTVNLLKNGTATGQSVSLATTNNWTASFTNIAKYGADGTVLNYSVQETTSLTGYQVPTYTGDTTNGFTVTNTLSSVPVQLTFKKVNGAGEALANVGFTLSGGNLSSPISTTSKSDGTVTFTTQNLTPGEYKLTETVPSGYTGTVSQTAFTIGNDYAISFPTGSSGTVTSSSTLLTVDLKSIVNTIKPFDLTLKKTGRFNQLLSGAHFKLTRGGTVVNADSQTDSNGSLTFQNLTVGSYTLEEITAPDGYVKLSKPLAFTIAANGVVTLTDSANQAGTLTSSLSDQDKNNTINVTVKNHPQGLLPSTGGNGIRSYLVGASVLIGMAVIIGSYLGYRAVRGRQQ